LTLSHSFASRAYGILEMRTAPNWGFGHPEGPRSDREFRCRADALKVMFEAFDGAWALISAQYTLPAAVEAARLQLAKAVIRDPEVIKRLALGMMQLP
jgi:hypothetical protein